MLPFRKVFDARISPQTVINADQSVLKLVPANRLQAKVEISDRDIGFVRVGLPVSVSVDSFPSGEFGYIEGSLTKLGSDVLPPDQRSQAYRFPATVKLEQQSVLSGDKKLNLQSGMGVSANIKLRSRPVISIISDMFTKQLDELNAFADYLSLKNYKHLGVSLVTPPDCSLQGQGEVP